MNRDRIKVFVNEIFIGSGSTRPDSNSDPESTRSRVKSAGSTRPVVCLLFLVYIPIPHITPYPQPYYQPTLSPDYPPSPTPDQPPNWTRNPSPRLFLHFHNYFNSLFASTPTPTRPDPSPRPDPPNLSKIFTITSILRSHQP